MQQARLGLRYNREERREAVREFVGNHYSEEGTPDRVPVNLLALAVNIHLRNLAAKNPRVLLSTFNRQLKPTVSAMQTWANQEIEKQDFVSTLSRVVLDALFSVGILKVALADPAQAASKAWQAKGGQPFCESIDLDDFVVDWHARKWEEVTFIGHRYRVPIDIVKDARYYSKARKQLTPSRDEPFNLEGDERIKMIGQQYVAGMTVEFEEHVDLWEVYLPRHRLVVTLADDNNTGPSSMGEDEPLRIQRWIGRDKGPYHILGYGVVPGNIMPKAPVQDWVDLHLAANRAYRKVLNMSERTKENTIFTGASTEDQKRLNDAEDGYAVRVDRPDSFKQVIQGGTALQMVLPVVLETINRFSQFAGNLDILGGLSPQSKTAHQDAMLNENSSRTMTDMQDRTTSFTSQVLTSLCWYWWHDPYLVQKTAFTLPGIQRQYTRQVTPQMRRQGRFDDLQIKVDPYSAQPSTPDSRLKGVMEVMTQVAMPMMSLLQQQGVNIDMNRLMQLIGELRDQPELAEVFTIQEPPEQQTAKGGGGEEPGMPQSTTRNYVRESMPGRTQRGNDMNMASAMLGVNPGGAPQNGQPKRMAG